MNDATLVILAAGMGSRYGGMKQIDHIGDNGETIIDFSIYDAYRAGFRNLVLIIKKEHEQLFEDNLVKPIRKYMNVKYAYQSIDDLPKGFTRDPQREKPWGTTQALLSIKGIVDGPFMVCNADDFYGKESFEIMYNFLTNEVKDNHYGMVGYQLSKTLSEHGTVTRAICEKENDLLKQIVEVKDVQLIDGAPNIFVDGKPQPVNDGICSMNYWGFTPAILAVFEKYFEQFLETNSKELKAEHVIPTAVGQMIKDNAGEIKVMSTSAQWFGVTYAQDKEYCHNKMIEYKKNGIYPNKLWD